MSQSISLHGRQFGLDWLRIVAFGLLIFYHIGMFFVPWGWHVKSSHTVEWAVWPMLALNPWRLLLLFVISGVASRALMRKLARPGAFASSRSVRLLLPLIAGMTIFVVPQPWFELRDRGLYDEPFLHFWQHDYFEFGSSLGTPLPTWNHLWFVVYLWVYSMGLAALAFLPLRQRDKLQQIFDACFSGGKVVLLPILWLGLAWFILHPRYGETLALTDDPYSHAIYCFAFLFGVGLAGSSAVWEPILLHWSKLLVAAAISCAMLFIVQANSDGSAIWEAARGAARAVLAWTTILGLLGFARLKLHHDGPWRRYLTEAIFPYYIAHQTIILSVGFWMKQARFGALAEFLVISASTLLGCALAYELAKRSRWLRPAFGLKLKSQREVPVPVGPSVLQPDLP